MHRVQQRGVVLVERREAAVGLGAVLLLRGVGAALAAGRERELWMAEALVVVADDAA